MGMVRKPSGLTTCTSWPQRSSQAMVLRNVTTTPFTCGAQASVASSMRKLASPWGRRAGKAGPGSSLVIGAGALQRRDRLPVDDPELARMRFDQRGEAFDPVAVVAVEDPADVADLRLVDVAAHDAVEPAPARLARERHLELPDVAHRVLHAVLEELRERPVGQPDARARMVEPAIGLERQHVEP